MVVIMGGGECVHVHECNRGHQKWYLNRIESVNALGDHRVASRVWEVGRAPARLRFCGTLFSTASSADESSGNR